MSAGGSEPDLNAVPSAAPSVDASATSSEDDKPKDKGSEYSIDFYLLRQLSGSGWTVWTRISQLHYL